MLSEHGVTNYTIFPLDRNTDQVFAYAEIASEEQWQQVAETEVCCRWWAQTKDLMLANPDNSPVTMELVEVFHLIYWFPRSLEKTMSISLKTNSECIYATLLMPILLASRYRCRRRQLTIFNASFERPPDDSRIMMRWWWFGPAVTKPELEREMRLMKEGGIGGFEVQPVYPVCSMTPRPASRIFLFFPTNSSRCCVSPP